MAKLTYEQLKQIGKELSEKEYQVIETIIDKHVSAREQEIWEKMCVRCQWHSVGECFNSELKGLDRKADIKNCPYLAQGRGAV